MQEPEKTSGRVTLAFPPSLDDEKKKRLLSMCLPDVSSV